MIDLKTLVEKEVTRFLRIWTQSLLPNVITTALYFLIFGTFLGSQINDISGYTYMAFIAPGLIMLGVILNSYQNVSSSFFLAKFQRSIEELLVAPISYNKIIIGYMMGGMLRGIFVGILITLVSLFFIDLTIYNFTIVIIYLLLTSALFSLAGLINGIYANNFDEIMVIPTFVLTPLIYLGGIFYSLDALPNFWQLVSKLNPILYLINGFRFGFLGISDINIYVSMIVLILFVVVFYGICYYLISRGIRIKS
tara:strand:+ start:693 stop:1448 length:756 start_codon:yes stop_codon:yes gene_type:complete